jgi:hypothetical protein
MSPAAVLEQKIPFMTSLQLGLEAVEEDVDVRFSVPLGPQRRLPDLSPVRQGWDSLEIGWRTLRPQIRVGMNRVPRLWRSAMLGFPLIPSPAGLGSRLASGPYRACCFRPERIGLPLSLSAAPIAANSSCPVRTYTATPSASSTGDNQAGNVPKPRTRTIASWGRSRRSPRYGKNR